MSTTMELYRQGRQLQAEKKFEEALAKLQEAAAQDDKDTVILGALTQCLTSLDRHEEAIATAKRIVEIEPDDFFSYIALSRAYRDAKMIPEAEYAMLQGQQAQMRAKP